MLDVIGPEPLVGRRLPYAVVAVTGALTGVNRRALRHGLRLVSLDRPANAVVDLSAVTDVDDEGVDCVWELGGELSATYRWLTVVAIPSGGSARPQMGLTAMVDRALGHPEGVGFRKH